MTVELLIEQTGGAAARPSSGRLKRYARPALGLLLPLGIAALWELIVWLGVSNGRLVPPPSRVFATIVELARSGELPKHILATLTRVYDAAAAVYRRDAASAAKLATEPLGPAPQDADLSSLAAWTAVANVVLNLDEFLMRP